MSIEIPAVGSEVEVVMANPFGAAQIPPGPKTLTYRGQVVSPYKWLDDRQFCITGDKDWPIRVIHSRRIDDLKVITGTVHKINTDVETFRVQGSRGNSYTVTKSARGWSCTCPGFEFRRNCRHIAELSKKAK